MKERNTRKKKELKQKTEGKKTETTIVFLVWVRSNFSTTNTVSHIYSFTIQLAKTCQNRRVKHLRFMRTFTDGSEPNQAKSSIEMALNTQNQKWSHRLVLLTVNVLKIFPENGVCQSMVTDSSYSARSSFRVEKYILTTCNF